MAASDAIEAKLVRIETRQQAIETSLSSMDRSLRELVEFRARETEQVYRLVEVQLKAMDADHKKDIANLSADLTRCEQLGERLNTRTETLETWKDKVRGGLVIVNIIAGIGGGLIVGLTLKLIG